MSDGRTLDLYLDQMASSAPAPGGGSAAALLVAVAAALGSKVCALTRSTADDEDEREIGAAARSLIELREKARALAERDEAGYTAYIAATRLPKSTSQERTARRVAVQAALVDAATVPLELARICADLLLLLQPVTLHGNRHLISDARIAGILAETAHRAALVTARVNVALLKDDTVAAPLEAQAKASERQVAERWSELQGIVKSRS
jgi:formiminotetrahydrofolate cyclodeaminase